MTDILPPVPGARWVALVLVVANVAVLWTAGPRMPEVGGPPEVRLVDEAGAPVVGEVFARCWHVHLDPPFTEWSGPTDAEGRARVDAPVCHRLDVAAVAPGRLPEIESWSVWDAPVSLRLAPAPSPGGAEVRALGWAGRATAGARVSREVVGDAAAVVVGWDLLADAPAATKAAADLWLEDECPDECDRVRLVAGEGAAVYRLDPVGDEDAEEAPAPRTPALWHKVAFPVEPDAGEVGPGGAGAWVVARDGRTKALLLPDAASMTAPCATEGCERTVWTWDVVVDRSGSGNVAHGLRPRLRELLPEPDGTGEWGRTPVRAAAAP